MRVKNLVLVSLTLLSASVSAANDVYGTVSELVMRSGDNGDTSLYLRLDVMSENSTFESCVIDGKTLTWHLDLSSPVANYQYDIVKTSYAEKLPVRIIGHDSVCENGNTDSDKIFELSPWSWQTQSDVAE